MLYGRSQEQLWYQPDEIAEQLNEVYERKSTANEGYTKSRTSYLESNVDSVILQRNSDKRKHLSSLRVFPTRTVPDSNVDFPACEEFNLSNE